MLAPEPLSTAALTFAGLNHEALADTVLATIINAKVSDLPKIKATAAKISAQPAFTRECRTTFVQSLQQPGRRFILECKRASPTLGDINLGLDIPVQVELYSTRAAAISVLTEEHFFKGSYEVLQQVRALTTLPVLCKDFVICEEQIDIAAHLGADAILLMLSVLTPERFMQLYTYAKNHGLDVLAEVSTEDEAQFAASAKLEVIGINNRDLKTLHIDLNRTHELAPYFAECPQSILVSESGIKHHCDIESLAPIRCFLIGSALCAPVKLNQGSKAVCTVTQTVAPTQNAVSFTVNPTHNVASQTVAPTHHAASKTIDPTHNALTQSLHAPHSLQTIKRLTALHMDEVLFGLNKICGNNTREGIECALKNHVALSGLIFVKKSPRYITPEDAASLIAPYQNEPFCNQIAFCGVFQDEELSVVQATAQRLQLSFIQLHGHESLEYISKLKAACPQIFIIKAIRISDLNQLNTKAQASAINALFERYFAAGADYMLLDSPLPGSGQSIDLSVLPEGINYSRVLLAGGLGANLGQVKQKLIALSRDLNKSLLLKSQDLFLGFDLNSKLETAPGIKDPVLIDAAFSI